MNDTLRIDVPLTPDEKGFVGRECPACEKYFKVKPGTGLPTKICHCPYCGHADNYSSFHTKQQIDYAVSVAKKKLIEEVVEPSIRSLTDSFKQLERSTSGGLFRIKVKTTSTPMYIPLNYYQEKELETDVVCDNCNLEFTIYGVFANCPDCEKLNALLIFNKSIEVARKRLHLLSTINEGTDLKMAILEDSLSGGVSAFDGFGKALQARYTEILPEKPKNLFQNLQALSDALTTTIGEGLPEKLGVDDFKFLFKMFQVRHIYEHNMGVVDADFVKKVPSLEHLEGKKYLLEQTEVNSFLEILQRVASTIIKTIEEAQSCDSKEQQ